MPDGTFIGLVTGLHLSTHTQEPCWICGSDAQVFFVQADCHAMHGQLQGNAMHVRA